MNLIIEQSKRFSHLVLNHLKTQYNLKIVKNITNLDHTKPELIYVNCNRIVLNNKIVNMHYRTQFDEKNYTLMLLFYKNIHFKNKNGINVCCFDKRTKQSLEKIKEIGKLNTTDTTDILVLGRKYINRQTKETNYNSMDMYCVYPYKKTPLQLKLKKETTENEKTSLFAHNLKNMAPDFDIKKNNVMYFDVEYINDIYDDFKTFPISKDTSLLFMIGFYDNYDNYTNYTVSRLNNVCEFEILEKFLNTLYNKIEVTPEKKIFIVHWTNADKSIIEKALQKYKNLNQFYNKYCKPRLEYLDLHKLTKMSISSDSYSLKYISKQLLNIDYTTDCKNGLEAMCSIIQNEKLISSTKETLTLMSFDSTKDVIQYNKLDTQLLYYILKHLLK